MLYKIIRFIFGPIFRVLYPFKVINKDKIPKEGNIIIVSNHLKKMDVVYLNLAFKNKIYILAKKEWFNKKIVANFLYKMGGVPVDREKADFKALKHVLDLLKKGEKLLIFPEGTRNKTDQPLLPLKDGTGFFAHRCNSTILPVFIAKRSKLFRKNYIYFGDPYKLDCVDQKFSAQLSEHITEQIREKLLGCKEGLDEYLSKRKK